MEAAGWILILINVVAGLGGAVPIARLLSAVSTEPVRGFRLFAIPLGVYFIESVAVAMGMGIPVFSVALALVWGVVFGRWLRRRASVRDALRAALWLALYSSLPAASFLSVPVMAWIGGRHILSTQEGVAFGIPEFLHLPWPLGTILGFYAALVVGALVLKVVITVGEVSLLIHLRSLGPTTSTELTAQ